MHFVIICFLHAIMINIVELYIAQDYYVYDYCFACKYISQCIIYGMYMNVIMIVENEY